MATQKFKNKVKLEAELEISQQTANRALVTNASKEIISSSVTDTELGHLSGVTSPIQTQINNAQADADAAQQDIDDHIADTAGAHAASAISSTPYGNFTSTDVQGTLQEASDQIGDAQADATQALSDAGAAYLLANNHINETVGAHEASAISNIPSGNLAATDVQGALDELQSDIDSRALDSAVIKKNGSVTYTADQPMGGFKLTGLGAPSANGHALRYDERGAANGVASLDAGGKVPASQLPNSVMEYQGTWNANTNSPALSDGSGNAGDVYVVSVAGTQDLGSGSITFAAGDWVLYSGSVWEKSVNSNAVASVFSRTGVVTAQSGDYSASQITNTPAGNIAATDVQAAINELDSEKFASADFNSTFDARLATKDTDDLAEGTNLYFTDERAQDAVGTILVDSASIDFTYNDGTPSITAAVLPAGVDHDALNNFVANEHIDHSSVSISTAANSGLSGGGDITTTRSLVVDINGTTAETSADDADEILIWDSSANARRKMTRANFLAGVNAGSAGDIDETSFSMANNQVSAANVTGFAFANATVRSFKALVSVEIDATGDLFESFELLGIQKGASWDMVVTSTGDDSGVVFSITNAGQIQYTSSNVAGFASGAIKFRAISTSV